MIITLSQPILHIVLRAPNHARTHEVDVMKLFCTQTDTRGVQISEFSSKLHNLLRTILKAVSVQNIISNEIYRT